MNTKRYEIKNDVRIVTAASLFDGHDASINIIRRMLQDAGAEVIHLGHNRSVMDIVSTALQEGAQGICVSSYQGGHMEFFKYMKDLLDISGASYVKIYGGGGGVIVHDEKRELEAYGITQIFHPDDGRRLGLEGMIDEIVKGCDFNLLQVDLTKKQSPKTPVNLDSSLLEARAHDRILGIQMTASELGEPLPENLKSLIKRGAQRPPILGVTGTGGAGKSSLVDELIQRFLNAFPRLRLGVLCVDPSKRKTGGALLGDRIRMNSLSRPRTFMRSIASRGSGREVSTSLPGLISVAQSSDFDLVIVETSGIGQSDAAITEFSDVSLYVMTSEFGAQSQLEKIDMIDLANVIAINKSDRRGSLDALRDVRKQYRRSRKLFHEPADEKLPIFLTQASHFNDDGVNRLFAKIAGELKFDLSQEYLKNVRSSVEQRVIPVERQNYLAEIVTHVRSYKKETSAKAKDLSEWGVLARSQEIASKESRDESLRGGLAKLVEQKRQKLSQDDFETLEEYKALAHSYSQSQFTYTVRDKEYSQPLVRKSLSGLDIRRVAVPQLVDLGDQYKYMRLEGVPGRFPYTSGVFELKRTDEDPKRQFAGEGTPERTNRRFHYLCKNDSAKRLSTAFDSVTLYGEDPHTQPDIFGKVGESGVSICSLENMKTLYSGFDLCDPNTSVSMTINGPAPILLAFFMNAAIDQQIEKKEKELKRALSPKELDEVIELTLTSVRGTVQADILKEDQAQNTCIFSTDFSLKLMGDVQEFFTNKKIRNFYSVSISGYHIAEAGANPVTQLAFTLSNGFTYVEYYLSRGLKIDDFAPNLSFFFSNGLDPEYSVMGRVARRIWAIAMKNLYKANERSQKLKYHIQTSGRSLHAQEIDFNDIRTTLQALLALYDNCNSLHTNAYDEAITTPTEESVRRAMAIQMIINREFGMTKNENPNQGSYFISELTDLVEEAVLEEFLKINHRGGVLGAMETQYQRGQIQEESLHYETLKHSGELPIIGVNTYINPKTLEAGYVPPKIEMARASKEEKDSQLKHVQDVKTRNTSQAELEIEKLKSAALAGKNVFAALMSAARHCTLGQMSRALYEIGGQYRRSI